MKKIVAQKYFIMVDQAQNFQKLSLGKKIMAEVVKASENCVSQSRWNKGFGHKLLKTGVFFRTSWKQPIIPSKSRHANKSVSNNDYSILFSF
jgi:hypothetical protein